MDDPQLRRWRVIVNDISQYVVDADTAADAGIIACDRWRAQFTPDTPHESGGRIWSVHTSLIRETGQ